MKLTIELDSDKCGMEVIGAFILLLQSLGFKTKDHSVPTTTGIAHGINCRKVDHRDERGHLHSWDDRHTIRC
jgi:hypothetical protein